MDTENKTVAYFSMEYAIHQSLKIYSGGLGFLSGSHMRSAHDLNQNITGIGILYTNGYYDQVRNADGYMEAKFIKKRYSFLKDIGIVFTISVHGSPVQVKAYLLAQETFNTAPIYLLTTDIPENDFLARSISFRLYDNNPMAKIAQFMLLGIGGAKLLDIINAKPDIYHLNEGHGLALLFHLYAQHKDIEEVKKRVVFTTHTPEKAGNDEINLHLLEQMNFFSFVPLEEVKRIAHVEGDQLNFTLTALRLSKIANGVSKIHEIVANKMWSANEGLCKIISITNAQNKRFWMDEEIQKSFDSGDYSSLLSRKKQLKNELLEVVADQAGKLFDENVLTMVWSRRMTAYKRPDLILKDFARFVKLVTSQNHPIQIIWAGKPYPEDYASIDLFNSLISISNDHLPCAVLTGYELKLSSIFKKGADVWLNTPRFTREASGTSGMTAAMNGAINLSIPDGWIPEFAVHGKNSFIIPVNPTVSYDQQDIEDHGHLMNILENEIIPVFYHDKNKWVDLMKNGIRDVISAFDADRMAKEYYEKLYNG